jgi:hypothetical protein
VYATGGPRPPRLHGVTEPKPILELRLAGARERLAQREWGRQWRAQQAAMIAEANAITRGGEGEDDDELLLDVRVEAPLRD